MDDRLCSCHNVSEYGQNIPREIKSTYFDFECSACGAVVSADDMGNSPLKVNSDHAPLGYCPHCGRKVTDFARIVRKVVQR